MNEVVEIRKHHYVCVKKIKFFKDYNLVVTIGSDYTLKIID